MAHDKTNTTNTPALIAWHVAERGEKKFWTRLIKRDPFVRTSIRLCTNQADCVESRTVRIPLPRLAR